MKQPMVVGNKGEIGRFILGGLLRLMPKALDILCVDINETDAEVSERIKAADIIFLCIPLELTIDWLLKYKAILKDKVIVEQCSLKEWLYKDDRISNLNIKSMHILFRPSQTPDLKDRKVSLFMHQFDEQTIYEIGEITESEIIWYRDAEEHDKEMAIQQALVHRTLLILGSMLDKCNGSTYISKRILELRDRIRKGNKDLYGLIQQNPYLDFALEDIEDDFANFNLDKIWEK